MSRRSTLALPVSLLISLLHVGCCLLPLMLAGIGSFSNFHLFVRYKGLFTTAQITLVLYLAFQVFSVLRQRHRSDHQGKIWSYSISFLMALGALYFGIAEPLQTEEQQLTRQRFEYIKSHDKATLTWEQELDHTRFASDLKAIDGVTPTSVKVGQHTASVSFSKKRTSKESILAILRSKGYVIELKD